MIAHSCLINWFFNASCFVRALALYRKWKINGFFFSPTPSPVSPVLLLVLPGVWRGAPVAFFFFFPQTWLDRGDGRGRTDCSLRALIWKAKGRCLGTTVVFCAQPLRNLMLRECRSFFKGGKAFARHHLVVHFYSSGPRGPITIRGEPSLQLRTSACVYQGFRCRGLSQFDLFRTPLMCNALFNSWMFQEANKCCFITFSSVNCQNIPICASIKSILWSASAFCPDESRRSAFDVVIIGYLLRRLRAELGVSVIL